MPQRSAAPPLGTLIAHMEKQIPMWLEESKVPGLSIAVIKDAKLAWRRGFGVKVNGSKEPVDNDTMFEAASMSKPVFAYVVMKMCEKGVMNLDTPLTQLHLRTFSGKRSTAGTHYRPPRTFPHERFSKLAVRERAIENPFHARRKMALFR